MLVCLYRARGGVDGGRATQVSPAREMLVAAEFIG